MAVDHNNPQSRDEEILIATIDGTEYNKLPQSRMEELLLELKETIEQGGGGTSDYENLTNQPQVNGETLIGDKTGADLGLVDAEEGKVLSTNDYDNNEKAAVAAATSAISAMKDGTDLDSFGDVEVALLDKADISDLGTAAAKDSTNAVTSGSTNLVESGAVKDAIDAAVSSTYHHAGTKTVAQLTHDLLIEANEGNVYNITDSGTTTSDFIEGIGKTIDEGSNVGICKVGNVYMFDLLSGFVDTTNFVQKSQTSGLLKNDGTVNTTIEDTVAGHTTAIATKQPITDNSLQTTDKTIPGAINELKSGLTNVQSDVKLNTQDLTTPSRTKNILPMTLSGIKSANTTGTWNGNVYTDNGVTFTVQTDVDGNITKITANGTAPATNTSLILASNADLAKLANNSVILNGSIGGASDTYLIVADHWNGDNSSASRDGDSVAFTPTSAFNKVEIVILNRYAPSNVEFYPMLRPATITNPTFAPYIPSVESRIEAVESGLTNLKTVYTTASTGTYRDKLNSMYNSVNNMSVRDNYYSTILFDDDVYRFVNKVGSVYTYTTSYFFNSKFYIRSIGIDSQYSWHNSVAIDNNGNITSTDTQTENNKIFTLYV